MTTLFREHQTDTNDFTFLRSTWFWLTRIFLLRACHYLPHLDHNSIQARSNQSKFPLETVALTFHWNRIHGRNFALLMAFSCFKNVRRKYTTLDHDHRLCPRKQISWGKEMYVSHVQLLSCVRGFAEFKLQTVLVFLCKMCTLPLLA